MLTILELSSCFMLEKPLSELLELVNSSAIAAGQCSIHETPQAHCSIAWTLLDTGISGSPEIPAIVETHIKASQLSQFEMQVTQVKCKIGKHITTMNLRDKVS
ncbi:hypothetical protein NEOLI_005081 [Neolecta irregularis DAH-3]|uniref:Uncharacterized protein n=1 Tax=Neolecta irregularis (strain DAH-3) TaxID=1198029 RepID=A0A1U7LMR2_NEOID|nr:hypothetical protein NEOLI_005081 [Neolecta irregularis DAH-3]|eukprot:OLL23960.1 hypothetical protein NEOLI_005081 [Neolecta irregularis DAH-3]